MAVWGKVGRGAWTAVRGGRALQTAEADDPGDAVDPVDTPLTSQEAVLFVRYLAATTVLATLGTLFLVKYAVLVLAGLVWWLTGEALLGGVLVVIFLLLAGIQWLVTRQIRRFGAHRELAALDDVIENAPVVWWPNLRRELERVGLRSGPLALLRLGAGAMTGRLSDDERAKFGAIDWGGVGPRNQWRRARRALADAAAARQR
ncbi:MAG TPA: hypothetical protein VK611_22100 [Acidimicrobiales bacterium]|nr:hypothetical protein [Acidimicrobiales bacterium]